MGQELSSALLSELKKAIEQGQLDLISGYDRA